MISKYLIQFSVDVWGCVPSLSFDLRPNYGGGNEENSDFIQRSHAHTGTLSASNPAGGQLLTHNSTKDSWTLMGKSESCGVIAPFSWVLVHIMLRLCLPVSIFQSCIVLVVLRRG